MAINSFDILILGGGASALMCACNLPKKYSVAIIESNNTLAKKLKISGGSKCNITNTDVTPQHYDGDDEFIKHIFKQFSKNDLMKFLERNKIELEIRKNRYIFAKHSSQDIIDALLNGIKHHQLFLNTKIISLQKEGDYFYLLSNNAKFKAKKVVVATGGKSFATLGATDIGLKIAKSFSISTTDFTPALVGLTVQKDQFWMRNLSGLSCKVIINIGEKKIEEEMLFTHKGISGPAVLSTSLYWKKGQISIDFLPDINLNELVQKSSKKLLSSALPLPKRLSKALLEAINFKDTECKKLNKTDIEKLQQLHNYKFAPAGNFGFSKAEVSCGGVSTDELDLTMQSKKVKGLYFTGEVVDVTGELGGYNLQWAFSSGYVVAKGLKAN